MSDKSKVLFFYDEGIVGYIYGEMDRCIRFFGLEPIVWDTLGHFEKQCTGRPLAFPTLEEAYAALTDYRWVFMHSRGTQFLDEYVHSSEPTIYAFGCDVNGFGFEPHDLGDTVRLRTDEEPYAYNVLPFVLYDRDLFLRGKRL